MNVKIELEMLGEQTFQFTVDQPIYPEGSVCFKNREAGKGSPLIERLFEIEHIDSILVFENLIKINITPQFSDWSDAPQKMEYMIRDQILSGEPAISEKIKQNLPSDSELKTKIQEILDKEINPAVAQHEGYIDLIDVKNNVVYIKMGGGCHGCGMSKVTLKQGVERSLREKIPQVGEILDVTDHASGKNPYYTP